MHVVHMVLMHMFIIRTHVHTCAYTFLPAVLATSGIDYDIKLWEPLAAEPCSLGDAFSLVK